MLARLILSSPLKDSTLIMPTREVYSVQVHSSGNTALHLAALPGPSLMIKKILVHHPDTTLQNKDGMTALNLAREKKQYASALILERYCVSLSAVKETAAKPEEVKTESDLIEGAKKGDLELVKNCVENHKLDVNCRDSMMVTPLLRASASGDHDVCRYLLENGANVNALNSYQSSSLYWAVMKQDLELCRLLLENGILHSRNRRRRSQLGKL